MAPAPAHSAGSSQKQLRRPVPRIVPAIPHRLSRAVPAARPITPEESNKPEPEPEPQPASESHPLVEQPSHEQSEQQAPQAVDTPLTPDSRTSDVGKSDQDAPSAAQHQRDQAAHLQDNFVNGQPLDTPAANGLHRKLTIPAQLPPPFYPSNKADLQTPPAVDSPAAHIESHRHQLSAGALVFRSANDSPATPATPHETEPDERPQQPFLGRPPPGFAPPHVTPFLPVHSHHPSDAAAPWLRPPYSLAPPDPAAYANGADYHSPSFPEGPAAYSSPYTGRFSPKDASSAMNGVATSHSQSPSKSNSGEVKFGSDQGDESRVVHHQNGTAPPAERLEESPFELAAYLATQFGNPEFADFILQIRSSESILVSIPVHGIVVARSPVIAEAMRRSPAPNHRSIQTQRLVEIHVRDALVTRESLEEAIKVLYGAPLLAPQTFLYGLGPYSFENAQATPSNDARRRMEQVLSYVAAARSLHIHSMQVRGAEIARMLLRWDTIDIVLHYGLQIRTGSRPRSEGPDTDEPFTAALLNYAIEFMAYTFPVDFKLYTIAPELHDTPRLPTLIESRTPTHNPRLSKIRFGDAPPEDDVQPNHATRVLSTVLLSLPLPLVERLFNHRATANQIGWTGAVRIMRELISEREHRRQKAHRGQLMQSHDGTIPAPLMNNMYMEERVEQVEPSPLYPSGHRLATKSLAGEA